MFILRIETLVMNGLFPLYRCKFAKQDLNGFLRYIQSRHTVCWCHDCCFQNKGELGVIFTMLPQCILFSWCNNTRLDKMYIYLSKLHKHRSYKNSSFLKLYLQNKSNYLRKQNKLGWISTLIISRLLYLGTPPKVYSVTNHHSNPDVYFRR